MYLSICALNSDCHFYSFIILIVNDILHADQISVMILILV